MAKVTEYLVQQMVSNYLRKQHNHKIYRDLAISIILQDKKEYQPITSVTSLKNNYHKYGF